MSEDPNQAQSYLVYEFERRAYPLTTDAFSIGRDALSRIVIREPSVSRAHAEVRSEGDGYVLHASGPTGTKLNGAPVVAPEKLTEGDRIEVGSAELTFRRGRLPLGVSVVDLASPAGHDPDAMTKRDTITNPILAFTPTSTVRKKIGPTALLLLVVLVLAAGYFFLIRR
ncbi:MAG: FHA domain-containing protein [Gemmatimonadales bacterium]